MSAQLEPGTIIAGKYCIDRILGAGGMGSVYAATNTAIGRRVAIKVLISTDREDVKRRFELEAQAASVIGHPGIVDVLDMGQMDDGEPFIVMEHLEGATLRQVYKKLGPFTPAEAIAVVAPMLDALAAAHKAGVIHRDIKPANVFICTKPSRMVKLLDFGVSKFSTGETGLTQTGTALGTPQYMAPEQIRGDKGIGPAADLYSVGAVLYLLLGGRPPYDADSDMATLARVLTENHEPLKRVRPELPDALCKLVDKLLVKEPEQRPSDAGTVRTGLLAVATPEAERLYQCAEAVAARTMSNPSLRKPISRPSQKLPAHRARSSPGSPRSVTTPSPPLPVARPNTMLVVAALAVLLAVGVGVGVLVVRQPPPVAVTPTPTPTPNPTPAPDAKTEIVLSADPAEARFTVGEEVLDCNPCTLSKPTGTRVQVHAAAEHFTPNDFELVFDKARDKHVGLAPAVAEAPTPNPKKPGTTPVKKPKGLTVDEKNPYE